MRQLKRKRRILSARNSQHGRRARTGFLLLLVLSAVFTVSLLFAKHQLETFRELFQRKTESITGMRLKAESVVVNGLRGLRVNGLEATLDLPGGPTVDVKVPVALVHIDYVDLVYGQMNIESIQVDDAVIRLERRGEGGWFDASRRSPGMRHLGLLRSFRILGRACRLDVLNIVGNTHMTLEELDFDVARLPESEDIAAQVSGNLNADARKRLAVDLRFSSFDDFYLTARCDHITAEDLGVFAPATMEFVESGDAGLSARLTSAPGMGATLSAEGPFEDLVVRRASGALGPIGGVLTAEGTIDTSSSPVSVNLQVRATGLDLAGVVASSLPETVETYGEVSVTLPLPAEVTVGLQGTLTSPLIAVNASVDEAAIAFEANDKQYPSGQLQCSRLTASWDSEARVPTATALVVGGDVRHASSGLFVEGVSGTVAVQGKRITVTPLTAFLTNHALVGSGRYDFESKEGRLSLTGVVSGLEDTIWADSIRHTRLAGSASFRCDVWKGPDSTNLEAEIDMSQAHLGYNWWFDKPPGITARGLIKGVIKAKRSMVFEVDADIASSKVQSTCRLAYAPAKQRKWKLLTAEATSGSLDPVNVGRCLRIPYKLGGGTGREGHYTWQRSKTDPAPNAWVAEFGCVLDEFSMLPVGGEVPLVAKELRIEGTVTKGDSPTGTLALSAAEAVAPRLGELWFQPVRMMVDSDPEIMKEYPPVDRAWTYQLQVGSLDTPPWKGSDFTGTGYFNPETAGLSSYAATVDGGHIEGSYARDRVENAYRTTAQWSDVPVSYFLAHLNYPDVVRGRITGEVAYSVDRDDPNTFRGDGQFEVRDGAFDADFLLAQFGDEAAALGPSLAFSSLKTSVAFEKDLVRTPDLVLNAEGLRLEGAGQFVRDGDMDYDIKVALSPDVANKVAVLRESFNIQGHRLAQQDIELAFKVTGPTFSPRSEVSGLPPRSVTLVSGALELTSEIIDIPRKILSDLFRIGGGMMGPGKSP